MSTSILADLQRREWRRGLEEFNPTSKTAIGLCDHPPLMQPPYPGPCHAPLHRCENTRTHTGARTHNREFACSPVNGCSLGFLRHAFDQTKRLHACRARCWHFFSCGARLTASGFVAVLGVACGVACSTTTIPLADRERVSRGYAGW